jgi:hypothetical protein
MEQIRYNYATNPLRLLFPDEWDAKLVTGVTLQVKNEEGTELLAAESITLYTATTLDADAIRYASSVTLAAAAGTLEAGDPILIEGVAGDEVQFVKGFNSTTKAVQLESLLDNAHDSGDSVRGLFGTHTLDTTTVADYPKGVVLTLIWTPTGHGKPIRTQVQVSTGSMDIEGMRRELNDECSRAYESYTQERDKFDRMLAKAERQISLEMEFDKMDYNRIVGQRYTVDLVVAKMALIWTYNGDEAMTDEFEKWSSIYSSRYNRIKAMPIWQDHNQDDIKDKSEVTSHEHTFERNW